MVGGLVLLGPSMARQAAGGVAMRQEPLSFPGEEEKGLQEGLKRSWWQSSPPQGGAVLACVCSPPPARCGAGAQGESCGRDGSNGLRSLSPLCPAQSLPLLYSPLNEVVGGMTFSRLIEVLQEMTRPPLECPELPLAMALKNQVRGPEEGAEPCDIPGVPPAVTLVLPRSLGSPCSTPC